MSLTVIQEPIIITSNTANGRNYSVSNVNKYIDINDLFSV